MRVDDLWPPLLQELRDPAGEAGIGQGGVERFLRIGVWDQATPAGEPMNADGPILFDSRTRRAAQSDNVDVMAALRELAGEELHSEVAASDQRRWIAVRRF
jgi:hypothetical protein